MQPEEDPTSPRPLKLGTALQHLWDSVGPQAGGCFPRAQGGGAAHFITASVVLAWHEQRQAGIVVFIIAFLS